VATLADNTQHIYWGPASSFALAEHVRQSILRPTAQRITRNAGGGGAHDVTPLLDVFTQRHLFFGTPPPPPGLVPVTPFDLHTFFVSLVPQHTAERFLENFKTAVLCLLPFYTAQDLATFLSKLYDNNGTALSSQQRANMMAVLAIGALVGTDTDTGESLFLTARQQNALQEDAVSLEAIQFWLLAAEYHLNMGRATPAYLAIGSACRKAAAMGLVGARGGPGTQGSVTAWNLYYYDWHDIPSLHAQNPS
jgi:transcription factor-like protein